MNTLRKKGGFSLIELLTVIAIIAILAGIIFPVMAAVKTRARMVNCMTNLHDIAMAVQLYQQDNRKYPETLGGTVETGSDGSITPFDRIKGTGGGLYPEYVKTIKGFHCPLSPITKMDAVLQVGLPDPSDGTGSTMKVRAYYAYDSYDVFYPEMLPSGVRALTPAESLAKVRYLTRWAPKGTPDFGNVGVSQLALSPTPGENESDSLKEYDYRRQLVFRAPGKDTIVTWCSFHNNGSARALVPVLFLDGHCDQYPAVNVEGTSNSAGSRWRIHSKG